MDPLLGIHPAKCMRAAPQQSDAGVAGQIPGIGQVDLALGEQRVDLLAGDIQFGHAGPAGGDHILGVVLVGGQSDRSGLDPQRNVLADQRHSLALGSEVGRTRQDPGVVGAGAEAAGQHRGIGVVELDVQCSALCPNGNGTVQPTVFEAQIVEEPQCLPGEPAQFVVVALGLQLTDHHQWDDDLMLGEPRTRPGIGQ